MLAYNGPLDTAARFVRLQVFAALCLSSAV